MEVLQHPVNTFVRGHTSTFSLRSKSLMACLSACHLCIRQITGQNMPGIRVLLSCQLFRISGKHKCVR